MVQVGDGDGDGARDGTGLVEPVGVVLEVPVVLSGEGVGGGWMKHWRARSRFPQPNGKTRHTLTHTPLSLAKAQCTRQK